MTSILFWSGFWLAIGAGFSTMVGRLAFLGTFLIAGSGVGMMIAGMMLRAPV